MFQGMRYDAKVGLTNFRYRDLVMTLGVFATIDPLNTFPSFDSLNYGENNLYLYCVNNPIGYVDPLGLKRKQIIVMGQVIECNGEDCNLFLVPEGVGQGLKDKASCSMWTSNDRCCSSKQAHIASECCKRGDKKLSTCSQNSANSKGFTFDCDSGYDDCAYYFNCCVSTTLDQCTYCFFICERKGKWPREKCPLSGRNLSVNCPELR